MKKILISLLTLVIYISLSKYFIYADNEVDIKELIGSNVYETGTKISKEGWKEGADTVVLLNSDAIIDAIVATPLAGIYDAPIILVNEDNIQKEMEEELIRLSPKKVFVIGGESVISNKVLDKIKGILPKLEIDRIGGANRYETSIMVAKVINEKYKVDNVYIGYAMGEADLISIAPKAGYDKSPIILTDKTSMRKDIYTWLSDRELKSAYIIGGEKVLSDDIINEVNKITFDDISQNRIYGMNRYDTNAKVIEHFYSDENLETIVVSSDKDYISTLMSISLASKYKSPIVLVSNELSSMQMDVLGTKYADVIYKVSSSINENTFDDIVKIISSNENIKKKDILFFIPHQDDEMLSFSVELKKYIDSGHNVKVILATDGSSTATRYGLNGERYCNWHKKYHDPVEEEYVLNNKRVDYIGKSDISNIRNDEFIRALLKLGMKRENIHFSKYMAKDKFLDKDIAKNIIKEYIDLYPDAKVHTFYGGNYSKSNHIDHISLGVASKELYKEGYINDLYMHIEPYLYDEFIINNNEKDVYISYLNNEEQKNIVIDALREYSIWDPINGKLAIGYHSVTNHFDEAINKPINYIIKNKYNKKDGI